MLRCFSRTNATLAYSPPRFAPPPQELRPYQGIMVVSIPFRKLYLRWYWKGVPLNSHEILKLFPCHIIMVWRFKLETEYLEHFYMDFCWMMKAVDWTQVKSLDFTVTRQHWWHRMRWKMQNSCTKSSGMLLLKTHIWWQTLTFQENPTNTN